MGLEVENGQADLRSSKNIKKDKKINGQANHKNAKIKGKVSNQQCKNQDSRRNVENKEMRDEQLERENEEREEEKEAEDEEEEEADNYVEEGDEDNDWMEGTGGYKLLKDERFITEDLVGELRERLRRVDNPEGLVEATKEIDKKCSEFIEKIIKRVDEGRVLDENGSKSKDFKKLGYRKIIKPFKKSSIIQY